MKALYFKKLDALRFFAFFLVFWHHAYSNSFKSIDFIPNYVLNAFIITGGLGVHIFFVISGFLITFLLLKEYERKNTINKRNFYLRRILRIWPLYYLVLLPGIFLLPNITNTFTYCGNIALDLTFLNNFDTNLPFQTPNISIAWSVAIEEQFYLFWPIIFALFVKNKKALFLVCIAIFIACCIFTILNPDISYYHSFGNLNYLMAGCIGGIAFNKYGNVITSTPALKKLVIPIIISIAAVQIYKPVYSSFVAPFLYLFVIYYVVAFDDNSGKKNIFSSLGKYTYGMYMYHPFFIIITKAVADYFTINYKHNSVVNFVVATLALVLTIGFSIASYELLEKHILKLKSKLSVIETRI